jgi:hypothetical protein
MRVKDLKDNYECFERNGFFHLYDPNRGSGMRNVYKYLCSVKKVGPTKFRLRGGKKTTSSFEELQKMIDKKLKSYKYDSEYYDPNYRRGVFEEFIIHDYLYELGFDSVGSSFGYETYVLKRPSIYGHQATKADLTFKGLKTLGAYVGKEKYPTEVQISLSTGESSWISTTVKRNVEDIKKGIDNLLKPLMITEGFENIKDSEKMDSFGDFEVMFKKFSIAAGFKTKDAKAEIKKRLLEMAEKL